MKKTTLLLALTTLVGKPTKTIPQLQPAHLLGLRGTFLALLAGCFAVGLAVAYTAPPSLQLLLPGKWPAFRGEANDVKVVGNYAYVALGEAGLAVIDVRNPTNCVRVGGCDTSGFAQAVAVSGDHAYVADGYSGVQVIDVSVPTSCVRVGGYVTSVRAVGVAVSGNYAYVANDGAGLQVIDVRYPTNCVRVGGYAIIGFSYDVTVSGRYAYVAVEAGLWEGVDYEAGLQVIDVSNPTNCVRVGGYDTSGLAVGVAVSGNYAYVADYAGLQVIDVSNPANCVRVGGYDTSWGATGVAVVAGRIYVADGEAGLVVLPALPNVQFTVRVDATPGVPFTLEAATHLNSPSSWTPLLTTNVPAMPFDYVDFDVKLSDKPQKYYRVRQP